MNNYIFTEEDYLAVNSTKTTNNFFGNNLYVGDLRTPATGFERYGGAFNEKMWRDPEDTNWNNLLNFIKDKKIMIHGNLMNVAEVIGAAE